MHRCSSLLAILCAGLAGCTDSPEVPAHIAIQLVEDAPLDEALVSERLALHDVTLHGITLRSEAR